jgi:hypothetical protein
VFQLFVVTGSRSGVAHGWESGFWTTTPHSRSLDGNVVRSLDNQAIINTIGIDDSQEESVATVLRRSPASAWSGQVERPYSWSGLVVIPMPPYSMKVMSTILVVQVPITQHRLQQTAVIMGTQPTPCAFVGLLSQAKPPTGGFVIVVIPPRARVSLLGLRIT